MQCMDPNKLSHRFFFSSTFLIILLACVNDVIDFLALAKLLFVPKFSINVYLKLGEFEMFVSII